MHFQIILGFLNIVQAVVVKGDLHPIPQNIPDTDPLIRFQPIIWRYDDNRDCAPHVSCTTGKICTTWVEAIKTCAKPTYGGQLLGRQAPFVNKYVVMWTAYYPFNFYSEGRTEPCKSPCTLILLTSSPRYQLGHIGGLARQQRCTPTRVYQGSRS